MDEDEDEDEGEPVSDDDRRGGQGGDDERPMLILGESRPDVEDTTPEELRRQEEEARREIERQRRELQEEIDRKRREAQAEIAEMEARKERELRERERELEETQEKLYRRESRMLRANRQQADVAAARRRLVKKPPQRPLRERGLRRSRGAVSLAVVAALGLGLGGLISLGSSTGAADRAELDRSAQARVLYLQSGLELDQAVVDRLDGRPVAVGDGGSLPGQALREEAVALVPSSAPNDPEQREDDIATMVDEGTGTVRALTLWTRARQDADYGVPRHELKDMRERVLGVGGLPLALVVLGLVAAATLAVMAGVARSWFSLGALVLAAVLGAVALPGVASGAGGQVRSAAEAGDVADLELGQVYTRIGQDLQAAYGASTSSFANDADYWTRDWFYDVEETPALESYVEARAAVGRAEGDEATYAAATDLLAAGRELFEERLPAAVQAREDLTAALGEARPQGGTIAMTLGGAALAGAGVFLSRGRKETA